MLRMTKTNIAPPLLARVPCFDVRYSSIQRKTRPGFVWVEVKLREVDTGGQLYSLPALEPFGMADRVTATEYITANKKKTGRKIPSTVFVSYLDNFLNDGSKQNKV